MDDPGPTTGAGGPAAHRSREPPGGSTSHGTAFARWAVWPSGCTCPCHEVEAALRARGCFSPTSLDEIGHRGGSPPGRSHRREEDERYSVENCARPRGAAAAAHDPGSRGAAAEVRRGSHPEVDRRRGPSHPGSGLSDPCPDRGELRAQLSDETHAEPRGTAPARVPAGLSLPEARSNSAGTARIVGLSTGATARRSPIVIYRVTDHQGDQLREHTRAALASSRRAPDVALGSSDLPGRCGRSSSLDQVSVTLMAAGWVRRRRRILRRSRDHGIDELQFDLGEAPGPGRTPLADRSWIPDVRTTRAGGRARSGPLWSGGPRLCSLSPSSSGR